ncbi:hypothetical protein C7974DRAFT_391607 [Boeremia exigua]|uniref:uncharacterized protein n=1 Tax=Boeremia exigua TaxID=749465 RepID=UPI001E8E3C32|nr:uncharacterized protein C7974DRAFT_391607 [Boeremia exigua]KAH6638440.1 hypothetical protein C7974DRAFT_391607 [Boeremia exigua]
MGIGPSDTQPGDTVAVIPGGGVPYVIRPNRSGWTLVGESYVQGIMNGEVVAGYSDGAVVMEWFDLV